MLRFASKVFGNLPVQGSSRSLGLLRFGGIVGVLLSLLGALCAPGVAAASPVYGYFLITYYEFESGCQGCHETALGGAGTVTQPFGQTMISLGLMGNNDYELLLATLNKLGTSDSDGDGATDVDEIVNQGDPNDPAILPEATDDTTGAIPEGGETDPAGPDTSPSGTTPTGTATTAPTTPGGTELSPGTDSSAGGSALQPAEPPSSAGGCGVAKVNNRGDRSSPQRAWMLGLVLGAALLRPRRRA